MEIDMSLRRFTFILFLAVGCQNSPEVTIKKLGGREPVLCVYRTPKYNTLWACRDGQGDFWICGNHSSCMPVTYPEQIFRSP